MMDDFTKGALIGGVIGVAANNLSRLSESEKIEEELKRRFLSTLSETELRRRLEVVKEEEHNKSKFMFWLMMFIGCFIFPWFCIPICVIGVMIVGFRETIKEYKDESTKMKTIAYHRGGSPAVEKVQMYKKMQFWSVVAAVVAIPLGIITSFPGVCLLVAGICGYILPQVFEYLIKQIVVEKGMQQPQVVKKPEPPLLVNVNIKPSTRTMSYGRRVNK